MAALAIGLFVASVMQGSAVEPAAEPAETIAEIEKLGGTVRTDETTPDRPVVEVDLEGAYISDATLSN